MWWLALAQAHAGWVLEGPRIVDAAGERTVEAVVVDGDRLVAVGDLDPAYADWPRIDAAGATVVPGLIDAHVHLLMTPGGAFMGDSAARRLWAHHLRAYVASGVAAVLDTGIALDDARTMVALEAGPAPTLRFLGPLVSPAGGYPAVVLPDSFEGVATAEALTAQLEAFDPLQPIGVKVTFEDGMVRPIWPLYSDEVRAALAAQPRPLMAHAIEPHEFEQALDLGVAAFVHPPERVDPDLIARLSDTPVVSTLAVMDTMLTAAEPDRLDDPLVQLVVPSAELEAAADPDQVRRSLDRVARAVLPRLPDWLRPLVITQMARSGPITRRLQHQSESVLALHEAGVTVVAGSDSGNWPVFLFEFHGPTTVRELELLQAAGIPPADVITIGTRNGAQLLGLDGELGTIEVGKRACFLVVDGDPLADVGVLRSARWVVYDGERRSPAGWMETP